MSTALKDRYNADFFDTFAKALMNVLRSFNQSDFKHEFTNSEFTSLELKQRMSYIANVLKRYLSNDFNLACNEIIATVDELKVLGVQENFEYMFLPDFVATNGIEQFEISTETLARTTHFTSSEFAVRPFILKYPKKMMTTMLEWTTHKDPKIRRLASEGCRPRLPWAMALPEFKQNPSPILPILEKLKNDPDELVRRSVANNLNDISKDNPATTIAIAKKWFGHNKSTDSLIKHACRGLLKEANKEVLALFGISSKHAQISGFAVKTKTVQMGNHLIFEFTVSNSSPSEQLFRLEYGIYLLKKNGSHSKKVFKISERKMSGSSSLPISKKHHFKPITTRVYYSGEHYVAAIINGQEVDKTSFRLIID